MSPRSTLHTPTVVALSLAAALGMTFTGCTTAPVPDEQMAVAEAAVTGASSASMGETTSVSGLAESHGEASPVASNDTAEGRRSNRRVEIVFARESGDILTR